MIPNAPAVPPSPVTLPQQRLAAFCSTGGPEVFHSIVHQTQVWTADPFDVETIHVSAREQFERLLNRAAMTPPPEFGKVLLLLGEAGSGKTHLMRAFRNCTHAEGRGYCGYLQMTSQASNYARYLLSNLIDALEQPYYLPAGETSGLTRLALGLLESLPLVTPQESQQFRDGHVPDLAKRVEGYADQVVGDLRFKRANLDLIRALFYLLRDDPRVKSRVLKWLRCEDLAPNDRALLGDLAPRTEEEHPREMVVQLGRLMATVHGVPLVLGVDQLEEMFNQDAGAERFRKMIDTLVAVTDAVPTAVVVIACMEDYFTANRHYLTMSKLDRLELDPAPIRLTGQRTFQEIEDLVGRRLKVFYEEQDIPADDQAPTFPFSRQHLAPLVNFRTRAVLDFCRSHREKCLRAGQWVEPEWETRGETGEKGKGEVSDGAVLAVEQTWNDFLAGFKASVPDDEPGLAKLLAWAIKSCSEELSSGHWFGAEADGRMVPVEIHGPDNTVDRLLVAVCDRGTQGGGLRNQLIEVEREADETPIAIVRSTAFPTNPKAEVVRKLGKLICKGARKAVAENADWRRMLALRAFDGQHGKQERFKNWRRQNQPLTQVPVLRQVLALDRLTASKSPPAAAPPAMEATPAKSPAPVPKHTAQPLLVGQAPTGPLSLGTSKGVTPAPVTIDPEELKQHAAFLGASGSGKTTAALTLVEQLLLRGIPAVLLDRKGDLCGYADPKAWERPLDDPAQAARRRQLRERLDVAVFTPGHLAGRPLTISVAPAGIDQLATADREQLAGYAAAALGGMMAYKARGPDQSRLAILRKAIEVLGAVPGSAVTIPALRQLIEGQDEALLNAVGGFDGRLYRKLGEDLLTLWLQNQNLLAGQGEPLDIDLLLGRGAHARPGKTRLSVISTRFLPDSTTDFWVAQLLLTLSRWIGRHPSPQLQAVFLFDEADQYLPALRQPATKAPMENLLKRARSAGVGLMLATQSPGDFDYKCRDTIRTWLVGKVKEQTALGKLKPMFAESKIDVAAKLPTQGTGQFYLMRDKEVGGLQAQRSLVATEQLPEERIAELAKASRKGRIGG